MKREICDTRSTKKMCDARGNTSRDASKSSICGEGRAAKRPGAIADTQVGMTVPSSGRGRNSGANWQSQCLDHPAQMIPCLSDNGSSPMHQLKLADPIMLVAESVGSNGSLQFHSAEQLMVA